MLAEKHVHSIDNRDRKERTQARAWVLLSLAGMLMPEFVDAITNLMFRSKRAIIIPNVIQRHPGPLS